MHILLLKLNHQSPSSKAQEKNPSLNLCLPTGIKLKKMIKNSQALIITEIMVNNLQKKRLSNTNMCARSTQIKMVMINTIQLHAPHAKLRYSLIA